MFLYWQFAEVLTFCCTLLILTASQCFSNTSTRICAVTFPCFQNQKILSSFELIVKPSFTSCTFSCSRPPRLQGLCHHWDFISGFNQQAFYEKLGSGLLPVEWSTGPPPLLLNRAMYRSGYAFSRATHRSRKWSLSLFISIFKRWSTFSALDEQFWSSSNLSSWLKVPETISSSITRSASVMDSSKFWWHWSSNSLCFGSIAICRSSVAFPANPRRPSGCWDPHWSKVPNDYRTELTAARRSSSEPPRH